MPLSALISLRGFGAYGPSNQNTEDADIEVLEYLEKNGCLARVVSIVHLEELRNEVKALHTDRLLDEGFYHEWMVPRVDPKKARGMSKAKSIFVAAFPTPATITKFHWAGQTVELMVPPTYGNYVHVSNRLMKLLKEAFLPEKHWIARAVLPVKLLAARSGLAQYGKNNITYIPKNGSFHTLAAVYTDFESPEDHWQEKVALPKCEKCKACTIACPTGAISGDRFLIHVERCLTLYTEKAASQPFPDWIPPSAHNSIIGCMRCQRVCPYDKEIIGWHRDSGEFSEKETAYLLKGNFSGAEAKALERKLKRVGLDLSVFPRNLEVHLRRMGLLQ